ncbi:MAG: SixA phosphatase family protein, partial [Brevefilum sp.]
MKTLLLMRHAKSSWKDDNLTDHARPLKKRGRKDAKRIAQVMDKNDLIPDLILSSSAVRAAETAEIIADNLG